MQYENEGWHLFQDVRHVPTFVMTNIFKTNKYYYMKSIFTFLMFFLFVFQLKSQSPIVINAGDIPIPNGVYDYDEISSKNPASPNLTDNGNYDFSSYFGDELAQVQFFPEFDPFYTDVGVDVYTSSFKNLTAILGYILFNEIDVSDNGIDDKGVYIDEQVYSLKDFTGNQADNITIPQQGYITSIPRRIMQFPMTANSSWKSSVKYTTNFNLSIASFGLSNVPCQHVYYTNRKDSIVSWGKLRVYTPDGPSMPMDVLISKTEQFNIDSFYVGGAPAPAVLLNAFNIKQAQKTGAINHYNFYRSGNYGFVMRLDYNANGSFTQPTGGFVSKDNITTASTKVNDNVNSEYSTLLFPNPSMGNQINLSFFGKEIHKVNYSISDVLGKEVQLEKNIPLANNTLIINTDILPGNYFVKVTNHENTIIAIEQVTIK